MHRYLYRLKSPHLPLAGAAHRACHHSAAGACCASCIREFPSATLSPLQDPLHSRSFIFVAMDGYAFSSCVLARLVTDASLTNDCEEAAMPSEEHIIRINIIQRYARASSRVVSSKVGGLFWKSKISQSNPDSFKSSPPPIRWHSGSYISRSALK